VADPSLRGSFEVCLPGKRGRESRHLGTPPPFKKNRGADSTPIDAPYQTAQPQLVDFVSLRFISFSLFFCSVSTVSTHAVR
jgi:hypothetical protein